MKKIQFSLFGRIFNLQWFYLLVYLMLLSLLISLGFWQLGRSDEKRLLLDLAAQQEKIITELNPQTVDDSQQLRYQQLTVKGRYDTQQQFLLDNQIVAAKAGYFVLTPFILHGSQKAILVNRGWLPAHLDRSRFPDISFENPETVTLTGRANTFPSVGIKLKGAEIPTKGFPALVQVIDSPTLARKLGYPLFSFQLELAPNHANGYRREWLKNTLITPEKHTAYAVQWFSLALTLTLLFFWYSSKKHQ